MKRTVSFFSGLSGLLVVLLAAAGILSIWHVKSMAIRAVHLGFGAIAAVVQSGEATLKRFDTVVSQTLPPAMDAVEQLTLDQRQGIQVSDEMMETARLRLLAGLLPQLDELRSRVRSLARITASANETLALAESLMPTTLPRFSPERWQSMEGRLTSMQDSARELAEGLAVQKDMGEALSHAELTGSIRAMADLSSGIKEWMAGSESRLLEISGKIKYTRGKIIQWVRYLSLGVRLVLIWIAAGQIVLLRHFWKGRQPL